MDVVGTSLNDPRQQQQRRIKLDDPINSEVS